MTRIVEKNVAELIMLGLIATILLSSCGSAKEMKKCCKQTVQEVYEYEGLTVE